MQNRINRKLDLEVLLSQIEPHPAPHPNLEQYTTTANVAATLLYMAAYQNGDIINKTVVDLGCGTGRLMLGAAFLGAGQVVGVDIDKIAISKAIENAARMKLIQKADWIVGDIDTIHGMFDTVLQNPPFGVQKPHADRRFLAKALEIGRSVYSIHKNHDGFQGLLPRKGGNPKLLELVEPSPFLRRFVEAHGGRIRQVYVMCMEIPHMFSFHNQKKHRFLVDLYVLDGKKTNIAFD